MSEPAAAPSRHRFVFQRDGHGLVLAIALAWLVGYVIHAVAGSSPLASFRNDAVYPSAHYLTRSVPGMGPMFAHALATIAVGLVVLAVVHGSFWLLRRRGVRDRTRVVVFAAWPLISLWCYAFFRVPHQVAVVDADAHRIAIRELDTLTHVPSTIATIAADEIRGVTAVVVKQRRRAAVVQLRVATAEREWTLGNRDCGDLHERACLQAAQDDVAALFGLLARPSPDAGPIAADGLSQTYGWPPLTDDATTPVP